MVGSWTYANRFGAYLMNDPIFLGWLAAFLIIAAIGAWRGKK